MTNRPPNVVAISLPSILALLPVTITLYCWSANLLTDCSRLPLEIPVPAEQAVEERALRYWSLQFEFARGIDKSMSFAYSGVGKSFREVAQLVETDVDD